MRIGLAQIDCVVGDIDANCDKICHFAELARSRDCDVVIFPEMSDTGYVIPVIRDQAREWSNRPFTRIQEAARENSISIICGLSERAKETIYNSIAVVNSTGDLLAKYRKTHLFCPAPVCEDECFDAGETLETVKLADLTWGLSICYDLRFPELYRRLTLDGAHVLLNCAAWPAVRPTHWEYLSRARAIENQCYFIGVNRVGTDGQLTFNGRSMIVEPMGEVVAQGSADTEELVIGEIELQRVVDFREAIPVNKSRRSDIYGDLKRT